MGVILLLVDDDAVFRSLAAGVLRDLGIDSICEAGTAASAMEVAHKRRPAAALIDVGLPDRDGLDLAHEIAALAWHPAVVLISADCDARARIESGGRAALAFVPKDDLPNAPLLRLLRLE
jgi:DNA-binding NarL/FixJ family response regulator